MFARLYHLPRAQRRARITEALRSVGLEGPARDLGRTHSGGMVRQLEIVHVKRARLFDEEIAGA